MDKPAIPGYSHIDRVVSKVEVELRRLGFNNSEA